MSPAARVPYPEYDVRKILHCMRNPSSDLIQIMAHRGMRLLDGATENSLSSIASAARAGWEGMEIDLRLTKDGEVILFHDEGIGRIVNVPVPKGKHPKNPFTSRGYSPLLKDINWYGELEHMNVRDVNGNVTSEHVLRLDDLLTFIREEGINIVLHLDIKSAEVLPASYTIISRHCNADGVPAIEWCIWKPRSHMFPDPESWEAQPWVQAALKEGKGLSYTPLYEVESENTIDSLKAWSKRDYLLTYEMHVPRAGGELQEALDYVLEHPLRGVGSWYINGDLPMEYYEGESNMQWDDSQHRDDILKCGKKVPVHLQEWQGVVPIGGRLGHPYSEDDFDGRAHLDFLVEQGFTYITADPLGDLKGQLERMGKRNTSRMMK